MTSQGINAHEEPLFKVLWGVDILEVPPYQRNFAWDEEQVGALWDDAFRTSRGSDVYFLGSVVLVKTKHAGVYELLDGQQRLASLLLMLAAFRDVLKDERPKSDQIATIQTALTRMDMSGRYGHKMTARLHLNHRDRTYFASVVGDASIPEPEFASHRLLKKAYEYFKGRIEKLVKEGQDPEALWESLRTAFTDRLYIIRIEVGDEVQAQMIFEALNSAGLDLTQADLIKNYLLRETPGHERDAAYKAWSSVADQIEESTHLTNFVRVYWNSAYSFARKDELYKRIKEGVKKPPLSSTQVDVKSFLTNMKNEAQEWIALQTSSLTGPGAETEQANDDLRELRELGAVLIFVPLLALRKVYAGDMATFARSVRWFRDFYVRYTIVGKKAANEVEEPYSRWAISLRNGTLKAEDVYDELVKLSPTDDEFEEAFRNLSVRTLKVGRVLLARINDAADPTNNITKTMSSGKRVHLEHIVPRSPEKWQVFLDAEGLKHEEVVHSIGNMTLLVGSRNISISNSEFGKKQRDAYAQGRNIAPINEELATAKQFGKAELEARKKWLASRARSVWTLHK